MTIIGLIFLLNLLLISLSLTNKSFPFATPIAFFALVIPATYLRIGFDADQYAELFYSIPAGSDWSVYYQLIISSNYEYGFLVIMAILAKFYLPHEILFLTYSSAAIFIILFLASKNRELIIPTLFIYSTTYYLWNEHVQMRQGLSSALFLLSLYFINNHKIKSSLCAGFFSALCHRSGYFFLLGVYLRYKLFDKRSWLLILFFGFLLGQIFGGYKLLMFLDSFGILHWKLSDYLTSDIFTGAISFFSFRVLKSVVITSCILYFWKRLQNYSFMFLLAKVYLLGVFFQFLLIDFYILSIRISQFFMLSEIFLLPWIVRIFFGKVHVVVTFFISTIFLINAM
jgi:hypothetical protein